MSSRHPHRPVPPSSDRAGDPSVRVSRVRKVSKRGHERPGLYTPPLSFLAGTSGNVTRPQIPSFDQMFPAQTGPSPLSLPGGSRTSLSREVTRPLQPNTQSRSSFSSTPQSEPLSVKSLGLTPVEEERRRSVMKIPLMDPLTTDTTLLSKLFQAYKVATVVMQKQRQYSQRDQPRQISGQAQQQQPLKSPPSVESDVDLRKAKIMLRLIIRPQEDGGHLAVVSQFPSLVLVIHLAHCLTGGIERVNHVSVAASTLTAMHDALCQFLASDRGIALVMPHILTVKELVCVGEQRLSVLHKAIDAASASCRSYIINSARSLIRLGTDQNNRELPIVAPSTLELSELDERILENTKTRPWSTDRQALMHAANKLLLVGCAGGLSLMFLKQMWARGLVFRCFDDLCRAVAYEHELYIQNRNTVLAYICRYNGAIYVLRQKKLIKWRSESQPGLPSLYLTEPAHGIVAATHHHVPFTFTTQTSRVSVMTMNHLPPHTQFAGVSHVVIDIHSIDRLLTGSANIYTDLNAGEDFYIKEHVLASLVLCAAAKQSFNSMDALCASIRSRVRHAILGTDKIVAIPVSATRGMQFTDTLAALATRSIIRLKCHLNEDRSALFKSQIQSIGAPPSDLAFVLLCSDRILQAQTQFLRSMVQLEEAKLTEAHRNASSNSFALKQLVLSGISIPTRTQTLEIAIPLLGSVRQAHCLYKRLVTLSKIVAPLSGRFLRRLVPKTDRAALRHQTHLFRVLVTNITAIQLGQPCAQFQKSLEKIAIFSVISGIVRKHVQKAVSSIKTTSFPLGLRKQAFISVVERSYAAVYTHIRSLNRRRTTVDVLKIVSPDAERPTPSIQNTRRKDVLPGVYPLLAVITPKPGHTQIRRRSSAVVGGLGSTPSVEYLEQPYDVIERQKQQPALLTSDDAQEFDHVCRNPTSLFSRSAAMASCTCGYCESFSSLKTLMDRPWDIFDVGTETLHIKVALLHDAMEQTGIYSENNNNDLPSQYSIDDYLYGRRSLLQPTTHPYAITRMDLYAMFQEEDFDYMWLEQGNIPERYNAEVRGLLALRQDSLKERNIVIEAQPYPKYQEDHGAGPGLIAVHNYEDTYSEAKGNSGTCESTLRTPVHVVIDSQADGRLASTVVEVEGMVDANTLQNNNVESYKVEMNMVPNIPKKAIEQDGYMRMYCDVGAHRYRAGLGGVEIEHWRMKEPSLCSSCEAQFNSADSRSTAKHVLLRELGETAAAEASELLSGVFVNSGFQVGIKPSTCSITLEQSRAHRPFYLSNSQEMPIPRYSCVGGRGEEDQQMMVITRRLSSQSQDSSELGQLLAICNDPDRLLQYLESIHKYSTHACMRRTLPELLHTVNLLHQLHCSMIKTITEMLSEINTETVPTSQRGRKNTLVSSNINDYNPLSARHAGDVHAFGFPSQPNSKELITSSNHTKLTTRFTESLVLRSLLRIKQLGLDFNLRFLRHSVMMGKKCSQEVMESIAKVYQSIFSQLKQATTQFLDEQLERVLSLDDLRGTPLMLPLLFTEPESLDSTMSLTTLPTLLIHRLDNIPTTPLSLHHPALRHVIQRKTPSQIVELLLETSGAGILTTSFLTRLASTYVRLPDIAASFDSQLPASLRDLTSPRSIRDLVSGRDGAWELHGTELTTLQPARILLPRCAQFASLSALAVALRQYIEVDFTKYAHIWTGIRLSAHIPAHFHAPLAYSSDNLNPLAALRGLPNCELNAQKVDEYINGLVSITDTRMLMLPPINYARVLDHSSLPVQAKLLPPQLRVHRSELWAVCLKLNIDPSLATTYLIRAIESKLTLNSISSVMHALQNIHETTLHSIKACVELLREILTVQWVATLTQSSAMLPTAEDGEHTNPLLAMLGDLSSHNCGYSLGDALRQSTPYTVAVALCQSLVNEDLVWRLLKDTCTADQLLPVLRSTLLSIPNDINLNGLSILHSSAENSDSMPNLSKLLNLQYLQQANLPPHVDAVKPLLIHFSQAYSVVPHVRSEVPDNEDYQLSKIQHHPALGLGYILPSVQTDTHTPSPPAVALWAALYSRVNRDNPSHWVVPCLSYIHICKVVRLAYLRELTKEEEKTQLQHVTLQKSRRNFNPTIEGVSAHRLLNSKLQKYVNFPVNISRQCSYVMKDRPQIPNSMLTTMPSQRLSTYSTVNHGDFSLSNLLGHITNQLMSVSVQPQPVNSLFSSVVGCDGEVHARLPAALHLLKQANPQSIVLSDCSQRDGRVRAFVQLTGQQRYPLHGLLNLAISPLASYEHLQSSPANHAASLHKLLKTASTASLLHSGGMPRGSMVSPTATGNLLDHTQIISNLVHAASESLYTPLIQLLQPHIASAHAPYILRKSDSLPPSRIPHVSSSLPMFPNDVSCLLPPSLQYWNPRDANPHRIDFSKFIPYYKKTTRSKHMPFCTPLQMKLGKSGWLGRFKTSVRTCLREGLYDRNCGLTKHDYNNVVMTPCSEDFMAHTWRLDAFNDPATRNLQYTRAKLRNQLKKSGFSVTLDIAASNRTSGAYTRSRARALGAFHGCSPSALHELDPHLANRSLASAHQMQHTFYNSPQFGSVAFRLHRRSSLRNLLLDVHPAFHNYKVGPCLIANYFSNGSRPLRVTILASAIILGDIRTAMSSVASDSVSNGVLCSRTFFRKEGYAMINVPAHSLHGKDCILRMVGGGEWCYGRTKVFLFRDYMETAKRKRDEQLLDIHVLQLSSLVKRMLHKPMDHVTSNFHKEQDVDVEMVSSMLFPAKRAPQQIELKCIERPCLNTSWSVEFVRDVPAILKKMNLELDMRTAKSLQYRQELVAGPMMYFRAFASFMEVEVESCASYVQSFLQSPQCFLLFVPEQEVVDEGTKHVIIHGDAAVASIALATAAEDDLSNAPEFTVDEKMLGPITLNVLHHPVSTNNFFPFELLPAESLASFGKRLPAQDGMSVNQTQVLYNRLQTTDLEARTQCKNSSHPVYNLMYLQLLNNFKFRYRSFQALEDVVLSMVEDHRHQLSLLQKKVADFNAPGMSKYAAPYSILCSPLAALNPKVAAEKLFSCFRFDPVYASTLVQDASLTVTFQDPVVASNWINEKYHRDRELVFEFFEKNQHSLLLKVNNDSEESQFQLQLDSLADRIGRLDHYHIADALPGAQHHGFGLSMGDFDAPTATTFMESDFEPNLLDPGDRLSSACADILQESPSSAYYGEIALADTNSMYTQKTVVSSTQFSPFQSYLHALIEHCCLPRELIAARAKERVLVPHVLSNFDNTSSLSLLDDQDTSVAYPIDIMRGHLSDRYALDDGTSVAALERSHYYSCGIRRAFPFVPAFALRNGKLSLDDTDMETMTPVVVDLQDAVISPSALLDILISLSNQGRTFLRIRDLITYIHYEHTQILIRTHSYAQCLQGTQDLLQNLETDLLKNQDNQICHDRLRNVALASCGIVFDPSELRYSTTPVAISAFTLDRCIRMSRFRLSIVLYAWALGSTANVDMLSHSKTTVPKESEVSQNSQRNNKGSNMGTLVPQLLKAFHSRSKRFSSIIALRDVLNTQHFYVLLQSSSIIKYVLKHISGEGRLSLLRHRPNIVDVMTEGIEVPESSAANMQYNEIINNHTGTVTEQYTRAMKPENLPVVLKREPNQHYTACKPTYAASLEEYAALRQTLMNSSEHVVEDFVAKGDVPKASNELLSVLLMQRLLPIFRGSLTRLINVLSDLALTGATFPSFSALRQYLLLEELHVRHDAAVLHCMFTTNARCKAQLNLDLTRGGHVLADVGVPYSVSKRAGRLDPAWPSLTLTLDPSSSYEILPCPHGVFTRVPTFADLGLLLPASLTDPASTRCITVEDTYNLIIESGSSNFTSSHLLQLLKQHPGKVFPTLQLLTTEVKTAHAAFMRQRTEQQVQSLVKLLNDINGPLNMQASLEPCTALESAARLSSDGLRWIQPAYTMYEKRALLRDASSSPPLLVSSQQVLAWLQALPPLLSVFALPLCLNVCTSHVGSMLVDSQDSLKLRMVEQLPRFKAEFLELSRWMLSSSPIYSSQIVAEQYAASGSLTSPDICSCQLTKTFLGTEPVLPKYHLAPPLAPATIKGNTLISLQVHTTSDLTTLPFHLPIANPTTTHIYTSNTVLLPSLVHLLPMFDRVPIHQIGDILMTSQPQTTDKALALHVVSTYVQHRQHHATERKKLYSMLRQPLAITSPLKRVPCIWELLLLSEKNKLYQHVQGYVKSYAEQERISKASRMTARQRVDTILDSAAAQQPSSMQSPPKLHTQPSNSREQSTAQGKDLTSPKMALRTDVFKSPLGKPHAEATLQGVVRLYAPFQLMEDDEDVSDDLVSTPLLNQRFFLRHIREWLVKRADIIPLLQSGRWLQSPNHELVLKWLTYPHRLDVSALKPLLQSHCTFPADFSEPPTQAAHYNNAWIGRALHIAMYVQLHVAANKIESDSTAISVNVGSSTVGCSSSDDGNVFTALTGKSLSEVAKNSRSTNKVTAGIKVYRFRSVPTFDKSLGRNQVWNHVESASLALKHVRTHYDRNLSAFDKMFAAVCTAPVADAWNTLKHIAKPALTASHSCGKSNILGALSLVAAEAVFRPSAVTISSALHPFYQTQHMASKPDFFLYTFGKRVFLDDLAAVTVGLVDDDVVIEPQIFSLNSLTPPNIVGFEMARTSLPPPIAKEEVDLTQFWLDNYIFPSFTQLNPFLLSQLSMELQPPDADVMSALLDPGALMFSTDASILHPKVLHAFTVRENEQSRQNFAVNQTALFATGSFAVALSRRRHVEPENLLMLLQSQISGFSMATRSLPWLYQHAKKLMGDPSVVRAGALDLASSSPEEQDVQCGGCVLQRLQSSQNLHHVTPESRQSYFASLNEDYALTMDVLPLLQTLSSTCESDLTHQSNIYLTASSTIQPAPQLQQPVLGKMASTNTLSQVAGLTLLPNQQPSDLAPVIGEQFVNTLKSDTPPTLLELDTLLETGSVRHLTGLLHFIELSVAQNVPLSTPLPSAFLPLNPYALHAEASAIPVDAGSCAQFSNLPFIVNSDFTALDESVVAQLLGTATPTLVDTRHTKNTQSSGAQRIGKLKPSFLKTLSSAPVLEEQLSVHSSLFPPIWSEPPFLHSSAASTEVPSITSFLHSLPFTCQNLRNSRLRSPFAAETIVPYSNVLDMLKPFSFVLPASADHTSVFNSQNVSVTAPVMLPPTTSLSRHGVLTACSAVWHLYVKKTKQQLRALACIGHSIATPTVLKPALQTYSYEKPVFTYQWLPFSSVNEICLLPQFGPLTLELFRILQYRSESAVVIVPKHTDLGLLYKSMCEQDEIPSSHFIPTSPDQVKPRRKLVPTTGMGVDYILRFQSKEVCGEISDSHGRYYSHVALSHQAPMDEELSLLPCALHIPDTLLSTVQRNMHVERTLLREKITNQLFHPDCALLPSLLNVGGHGGIYPVHHRLALCRVIASVLESLVQPTILKDFPSDGGMYKSFLPSSFTVSDGMTGYSEGIVQGSRTHVTDSSIVRKKALDLVFQNDKMSAKPSNSSTSTSSKHHSYTISVKPGNGDFEVLPEKSSFVVNEDGENSEPTNAFLSFAAHQQCTCELSGQVHLDSVLINGQPLALSDTLRKTLCPEHGNKIGNAMPTLRHLHTNMNVLPNSSSVGSTSTLGDVLRSLIVQRLKVYMKSENTLQRTVVCKCDKNDKNELMHVCTCFERSNNVVLQYKVCIKKKQPSTESYLNCIGLTSLKAGDILVELLFREHQHAFSVAGDSGRVNEEIQNLAIALQQSYIAQMQPAYDVLSWLRSERGLILFGVLLHPFYSSSGDNDSEEDQETEAQSSVDVNVLISRAATLHVPFLITLHTARHLQDEFGSDVLQLLNSLHDLLVENHDDDKLDITVKTGHSTGVLATLQENPMLLSTPMKSSLRASLRLQLQQQASELQNAPNHIPFLHDANTEAQKLQQQQKLTVHSIDSLVRVMHSLKTQSLLSQHQEDDDNELVFAPIITSATATPSESTMYDSDELPALPPIPILPLRRDDRHGAATPLQPSPFPIMHQESIFEKE